jgi:chromosome segregation ATPase
MTKKLDKEHLDAIQKLRTEFAEVSSYIGNISIEKHLAKRQVEQLESRETELMNQFERLQQEEIKLIDKLKERYGEGQINIAEGTFTPEQ